LWHLKNRRWWVNSFQKNTFGLSFFDSKKKEKMMQFFEMKWSKQNYIFTIMMNSEPWFF
jgi:hypothetical protein